ncbi:hypothetical protein A4212_04295 [Pasteurella multocida]|uniref:hypothetical protein n=1 Tax=Pasteurella multocida TaxID=747 RepID=UPI00094B6E55|nr:hypothetical protein [Pasteurella multocida]AUK44454.1 hypothetical protein A4212_04295 [Pasteurella multocida]
MNAQIKEFGLNNFANTLEQVVEFINAHDESGVQGFDYLTNNFIAAVYAYKCCEGYEFSLAAAEYHLEILEENGANFDKYKALELLK